MNKLNSVLCLLSIIFINQLGYSQTTENAVSKDFEGWVSAEFDYKINKKWNLVLEEQIRFKNNASEIDRYFTQLEGAYEFAKKWTVGLGFRYIRINDNEGATQGYEDYTRIQLDLSNSFKIKKLKRFSFKNRLRYQRRNQLGVGDAPDIYPSSDFRLKSTIGYNIKNWKLDPKISGELFYHTETGAFNGFTKYRLAIGTDYKIKKRHRIALQYMIERETKVWDADLFNIVRLRYTYQFKKK